MIGEMNVSLVAVDGSSEFDDLLGTSGQIRIDADAIDPALNWYVSGDDSIQFVGREAKKEGNVITVKTKLNNTFRFEAK